ncbi:apoptosis regulatory protein Siva-like isoform X1 [Mercenaria mercenaria]|uniref:apoptosis regulatory protein Siva-like isoform X1 n=1 Tax=Mercenaria mercenaria TaxID=6596 RepID=UPI00234EE674|nr:apoptosis regulatory protein Siva-like isoform X1 [Mercenaria mercenaria]
MPKRRNPFGECSPLQLKQHVGVKEIDCGIAQQQKMKSVYDRTRALLFSGSKRSFDVPRDANCNEIYPTVTASSDEVNMEDCHERQMLITNTGQLTNPEQNDKPANAFQALMMARNSNVVNGCQCCKGQAASQDRCGFCEKSICYDCVRSCTACDGHFCQLCSVMSPDDPLHQWFCQKCSYRLNPYIYWASAF